MAMSSGLEFNEDYGDVTDVTRMLYLEPDMAGFAAAKPLADPVGKVFSYSSGTSRHPVAALAGRGRRRGAGLAEAGAVRSDRHDAAPCWRRMRAAPSSARPISMRRRATGRASASSCCRTASGTASEILPAGFVAWMREEAPASKGSYGKGQVWLYGPEGDTPVGQDPDVGFDLPDDTYWLEGHDGQSVAIIPSKKLVVVRHGPDAVQARLQAARAGGGAGEGGGVPRAYGRRD